MKLKIIEWNINCRKRNNIEIPEFVVNTINKQDADIVVLTEFTKAKEWGGFAESLEKYNVFYNYEFEEDKDMPQTLGDDKMNHDILIAIKKNIVVTSSNQDMKSNRDDCPNFLEVEAIYKGVPFTVIGIRINPNPNPDKTCSKKEIIDYKTKQIDTLYKYLENTNNKNVIVIGDFNKEPRSLKKPKEYCIFYPRHGSEYSFVHEDFKKTCLDFMIIKGFSVDTDNLEYSWDFVNENKEYKNLKPEDFKSSEEFIGFPDHAILVATVSGK